MRSKTLTGAVAQVMTCLAQACERGRLRALDQQFARLMADLEAPAEVVVLAALVSAELGRGHVCLPLPAMPGGSEVLQQRLAQLAGEQLPALLADLPPLADWEASLAASPLVEMEMDPADENGAGDEAHTPLACWQHRLYLTRYQRYEQAVAARLQLLAGQADFPDLQSDLAQLFPRTYGGLWQERQVLATQSASAPDVQWLLERHLHLVQPDGLDWPAIARCLATANSAADLQQLDQLVPRAHCRNDQMLAAATAAARHLAVISGGPGTGKTTTVARLLALWTGAALAGGDAPVIRLAAPTGKAAARMLESLGQALNALDLAEAVRAVMPTQASTLHRLLGMGGQPGVVRHHAGNPLHVDLLVVDEASMIDLPMMAHLLAALPPHARLILLGDRDQLASVEAGAVLGDICSLLQQGRSPAQAGWLQAQTGAVLPAQAAGAALRDGLCLLQKSWRFDARSGIGQLAAACNQGDAARLSAIWQQGFTDISRVDWQEEAYLALLAQAVAGYRPYLQAIRDGAAPAAVFKAFHGFQVLCALRDGAFGVEGLNARILQQLIKAGLLQTGHDWYAGRPVMITQNDHAIGLYNGDIGLCLPSAEEGGRLRVWFEQSGGALRSWLPSRLPPHETVLAMTVHKSQGSEFDEVALVLPDAPSPLLTRELVYTGITRAKRQLTLYTTPGLLAQAIRTRTERHSGLAERLQRVMPA